jgi:hypothetical protein
MLWSQIRPLLSQEVIAGGRADRLDLRLFDAVSVRAARYNFLGVMPMRLDIFE